MSAADDHSACNTEVTRRQEVLSTFVEIMSLELSVNRLRHLLAKARSRAWANAEAMCRACILDGEKDAESKIAAWIESRPRALNDTSAADIAHLANEIREGAWREVGAQ